MNFSDALKVLWGLVAATDLYLTANAPWKKPAERGDEEHKQHQARVLATAAEAIRVVTALVYPILPDAAAKVWHQIGQGDLAVAAKQSFLANLAWGGLQPGTQFAAPAPLSVSPIIQRTVSPAATGPEPTSCSPASSAMSVISPGAA